MSEDINIEYTERYDEAYNALVKYLALVSRSEKECVDKLYEKGYHRNEVEFAIDKAKGYRYIDDEEYVRTYLLFNKTRYGAKKIEYKLVNEKGVDKRLVDNMIEDYIGEEVQIDTATNIANKYIKQKKIVDKSGYQKTGAYLYQKGFSWSVINKVLGKIFDSFDEE